MSRLHVVQGRSVGLRHARLGGPTPVIRGRWLWACAAWPAAACWRGPAVV